MLRPLLMLGVNNLPQRDLVRCLMEVLLIDTGALALFVAYMAIVYWLGVSEAGINAFDDFHTVDSGGDLHSRSGTRHNCLT